MSEVIIQWRVRSQSPYLRSSDRNWSRYIRMSKRKADAEVARRNADSDRTFEYRIKP